MVLGINNWRFGRPDVRRSPAGSEKGTVHSPGMGSQYSLHPLCVSQGLLDKKKGSGYSAPEASWVAHTALEKAMSQKE